MSEHIGRNDPCHCRSGKKYKNRCLEKAEVVSIAKYKYDRYLEARNNTCAKVFHTGIEELDLDRTGAALYLLDFLLFEPKKSDQIKNAEDFDNFLQDTSFLFSIYGYPIHEAKLFEISADAENDYEDNTYIADGDIKGIDGFGFKLTDIVNKYIIKDSIEDNYLWKHCLVNFSNKFLEEEKKFLNSIKDSIPGFFKVIDVNISGKEKYLAGYPVSILEEFLQARDIN